MYFFLLLKLVFYAAWSSGESAVFMVNMVSDRNPLARFCCGLGKDTLRDFSLFVGLGKQL